MQCHASCRQAGRCNCGSQTFSAEAWRTPVNRRLSGSAVLDI